MSDRLGLNEPKLKSLENKLYEFEFSLPIYVCIYVFIYLCIYIYLSTDLSIHLSIYLSVAMDQRLEQPRSAGTGAAPVVAVQADAGVTVPAAGAALVSGVCR